MTVFELVTYIFTGARAGRDGLCKLYFIESGYLV